MTLNSHIINRFSIFWCRWVPNQRSFIFWHFLGLLATFGCIYWPKTMKFTFFPWLRRLFKALDGSRVNQIPIFWALWIRNWKISLSLKFQFNRPILRRFRAVPSQKSKNDVLLWYKTETYLRIRKRAKSEFFFFSGSIYKARKHGGGPSLPFFCMMPPSKKLSSVKNNVQRNSLRMLENLFQTTRKARSCWTQGCIWPKSGRKREIRVNW